MTPYAPSCAVVSIPRFTVKERKKRKEKKRKEKKRKEKKRG